jgi:hypothetical protein
MGTRSLTTIRQDGKDSPVICQIYRQFDGYPEGMGKDLQDICKDIILVHGYNSEQEKDERYAAGMECLAATIIKKLKKRIGNIYLTPVSDDKEEFNYNIYAVKGKVKIDCVDIDGKKCKIP